MPDIPVTLSLTATERPLFNALSDDLRAGWQVTEEVQTYADTPLERRMRLMLVHLKDPKLNAFLTKAKAATSQEDCAALMHDMDLKDTADHDLMDLFFALGPGPLSTLIESLLKSATTRDDIESLVALTTIRSTLLTSMNAVS